MRIGDPCKFCLRPLTQKVLDEKHRLKVQNALNSVAKMKAKVAKGGKWPGGRKKFEGNDAEIKRLRKTGLSMREIAKRIGTSTTTIQRVLRE